MATLVIGCGVKLIGNLRDQLPDESVVVIEHPQVAATAAFKEKLASVPNVVTVLMGDYVHDCDARALVELIPQDIEITRVLSALDETTTVAAGRVAAALGLPGSGVRSAEIFQDKLQLREVTSAAGVPNPRWHEVRDLAELVSAARALAADGLVLKPSRRSGSQGVVLLDRGDDLADAWRHTTTAEGRVQFDPPLPTDYLVEERLYGSEVSIEALVSGGTMVFANITDKRVLHGRHPVEIGHVVPATMSPALDKELRELMQTLVDATGFEYGMLHCEWILTETGPVLVECAGRLPGDRITDLITLAYDTPFMARYAELMAGSGESGMPDGAVQAAAVRFLTSAAGVVESVTGVEEATAASGVEAAQVRVSAGDKVSAPRASRDRIGHVMAVGADAEQAWARVESAAALIRVAVR